MNLEDFAGWLFGRSAGGIRWGLDRTRALLAEAGDPQCRFRSVLIGGTNGKGSVAALCSAALRARATHRVGLYTSPHLVSFTERIQVDGVPIEPVRLLAVAEQMRPAIERTGATFFEATTAIAFTCFAESGVDVAIVEVGLGGRLDATNVLEPAVTAVTNVAIDHTEYLGASIAEIAREKGGIFKRGVPAITAERDASALDALAAAAAAAGTALVRADDAAEVEPLRSDAAGSALRLRSRAWGELELELALPGAFQLRNALLAAETLALLPPELRVPPAALRAGFAAARWPGRLQLHRAGGTTYVLDVAHNAAGAAALADSLGSLALPRPIVLVAGVLADKPWQAMLPPLLRRVDAAILTVPGSAPAGRLWNPEHAAAVLEPGAACAIRTVPRLEAALRCAASLAPGGTVLVSGSIHTVGDAMQAIGLSPFGATAPAAAPAGA